MTSEKRAQKFHTDDAKTRGKNESSFPSIVFLVNFSAAFYYLNAWNRLKWSVEKFGKRSDPSGFADSSQARSDGKKGILVALSTTVASSTLVCF